MKIAIGKLVLVIGLVARVVASPAPASAQSAQFVTGPVLTITFPDRGRPCLFVNVGGVNYGIPSPSYGTLGAAATPGVPATGEPAYKELLNGVLLAKAKGATLDLFYKTGDFVHCGTNVYGGLSNMVRVYAIDIQ